MAGKSAEFCEYTVLKGNSSLPSPERRFRTCRAHRPSKRQPAESKQYTPAKGPWSEPRCRPFPVAPQRVVTPLRRHSRTGSSWGQWRSLRHQRMQAPTSIPIRIPVSVCSDTASHAVIWSDIRSKSIPRTSRSLWTGPRCLLGPLGAPWPPRCAAGLREAQCTLVGNALHLRW